MYAVIQTPFKKAQIQEQQCQNNKESAVVDNPRDSIAVWQCRGNCFQNS